MTKDFLNSSGAYIKFLILALCVTEKCLAQTLPSSFGVHHKKNASTINYALSFDLNDYILTNAGSVTTAWTAEVWYKRTGNYSGMNFTNSSQSNVAGDWSLRLGQWNSTNKLGVTKYSCGSGCGGDYKVNSSTTIGIWEHVAWTYQNNVVTIYKNGISQGTLNLTGAQLMWKYIGKNIRSVYGEVDEIRFWDDKRTATEIKDNMFKELSGTESNLIAYYKMADQSGSTVTDNSSNNNNGIITGATWVTSNAPIGSINNSYQTNIEALWEKTGTSDSELSDGLSMNVSATLAEASFVVYGNNGTQSSSSTSILGLAKLSDRVWQFDETGTFSADIKIDISLATNASVTPSTASNYKLLYKSCSMCDYSIEASGSSISNTDNITFSSVAIKDGFYSIGSTDTNL